MDASAQTAPPPADDVSAAAAEPWSRWQQSVPYTLGVEEEVMLLDPGDWRLAQRIDDVLPALSPALAAQVSAETHQAAIELATLPHDTVDGAMADLRGLRERLAADLVPLGLAPAAAGTHPTTVWEETRVSPSGRHQLIDRTMGELARREPTFALHVHVGVGGAEDAIRLMNRLRVHLPLLLALSANSPFWQGRDSRLASARIPIFAAFPRTGIPRRFRDYADWRAAVALLIRAGAFPEPTFLWWDVRPQPRYGTVELRIMDAQTSMLDTAALCALVQSLARLELQDGYVSDAACDAGEALEENRFLATRDGAEAWLVDAEAAVTRPVWELVGELLDALRPHAEALGCRAELELVPGLVGEQGAARQRAEAERGGVDAVVPALAAAFTRG